MKTSTLETLERILRWAGVILLVIFGFWLAFLGFDLGGAVNRLLGNKKDSTKIVNDENLEVGHSYPIKPNHNPFRDRGTIELENGTKIELPNGIKDKDVTEVIVVEPEVIDVKINHDRLTDLFVERGVASSGGGRTAK